MCVFALVCDALYSYKNTESKLNVGITAFSC